MYTTYAVRSHTPTPTMFPGATPGSHPNAPMVLPHHLLRQVTSDMTVPDNHVATAPSPDWHTALGHPTDRWASNFCRQHNLPLLPPSIHHRPSTASEKYTANDQHTTIYLSVRFSRDMHSLISPQRRPLGHTAVPESTP